MPVKFVVIDYGVHKKGDVISTKHVKFAEDKNGYEWIYRKEPCDYRYNDVWSEDENEAEEPQLKITEDKSVSSRFEHAKQDEMRDERDSDEEEIVGASTTK